MVTKNTTSSRHTRIAFRITVHTQLHYLWWRLQLGNQTNQPMRKQNNLQTLPNLSIKYTFQLRRFKTKSSANEPQVGNHQKKKKNPLPKLLNQHPPCIRQAFFEWKYQFTYAIYDACGNWDIIYHLLIWVVENIF